MRWLGDLSGAHSDLGALRDEVDKVTLEMVRLLGSRSDLARRIGRAKQDLGMAVGDDLREEQLRSKVAASCGGGPDTDSALRLLNFLIAESVAVQSADIPSAPSHMSVFAEARRLEAQGREIIHMEVGEPNYGPPAAAEAALAEACRTGRTRYGPASGTDELRDAIARRSSSGDIPVRRENVIVTMGARFAVYLAVESLLAAGDEMIVIEPAWPAYAAFAMRARVRVRRIKTTLE